MTFLQQLLLTAPPSIIAIVALWVAARQTRVNHHVSKLVEYRHAKLVEAHAALYTHQMQLYECIYEVDLAGPASTIEEHARAALSRLIRVQIDTIKTVALVIPFVSTSGKLAIQEYHNVSQAAMRRIIEHAQAKLRVPQEGSARQFIDQAGAEIKTLETALPGLRDWMNEELNPGALQEVVASLKKESRRARMFSWLRKRWTSVKSELSVFWPAQVPVPTKPPAKDTSG